MQKSKFLESTSRLKVCVFAMADVVEGIQDETVKKELGEMVNDSYELIEKSVKACFVSDIKGSYNYPKLSDLMVAKGSGRLQENIDSAKDAIKSFATAIKNEIELHSGAVVHHDSGKTWKKTKTDRGRFEKLGSNMDELLTLV